MLSRTVRSSNAIACWNVRTIPRPAIDWAALPVMSSPNHLTEPPVGRCTPAMTLNNVVLPEPFGPMIPEDLTVVDLHVHTIERVNATEEFAQVANL